MSTRDEGIQATCALPFQLLSAAQRIIPGGVALPPVAHHLTRAVTLESPTEVFCPVRRMNSSSRCSQSSPS